MIIEKEMAWVDYLKPRDEQKGLMSCYCFEKFKSFGYSPTNLKNIDFIDYKGNTPLHFCYTYGYGDTLGTYLISKGADPDIRNHSGHVCYDGLGGTGKK
jgi:ankyrin repeat protein